MRRIFLLAAAGIVLAAAVVWIGLGVRARPAVVLDPAVLDFGPLSTRATREALVRNTGRAALEVLAITTSCGCTTAVIDSATVPPRGSARLEVTFDPDAHGPEEGPAQHSVYVRTNDPRIPEAELEVRAVVAREP